MALSLDDRLLGEKVDNYCSSDEGEREEDEEDSKSATKDTPSTKFVPEPDLKSYQGFSTNTGPKGVINDWREYKRLESEKREEQEKERLALAKKLTMTCRSHLDDEKEKKEDEELLKELEDFEDEFLGEYRKRRIEEMKKSLLNVPRFGKVQELLAENFVDAVDKENKQVTVIIHVYDSSNAACEAMNGCLNCLAQEYLTVKFCKIKASESTLSISFAKNGVPALLIYKGGELIGNFIRMSDEFGDDFFASDIESFLSEHSFLPAQDVSHMIRDSITGENRTKFPDDDTDSDFDVD